MLRVGLPLLLSVVLSVGCSSSTDGGSDDGSGGDAPTGGKGDASDCPVTLGGSSEPSFERPASRFGLFGSATFMTFDGAASQQPHREFHTEVERSGNCRLLTYDSPPFCDFGCENPQICVGGSCIDLPTPVSAGTLELRLDDRLPVTIEPNNSGRYAWTTEALAIDDVASVAVSAPGDVADGFELHACLFEAPKPSQDFSQLLAERAAGENVVLRWSNPVAVARVYLRMTTGIGTHGGISPVELECEGPDVGSLTLPGHYLDELYETGWACGECGSNQLWRYHATQTGEGMNTVQLLAQSQASFWFIPGVTP